jgi:hypothetical protein
VLGPPDLTGFANASLNIGCEAQGPAAVCDDTEINIAPPEPGTLSTAPADGTVTSWNVIASAFAARRPRTSASSPAICSPWASSARR